MLEINWKALNLGEWKSNVSSWNDQDMELATAAVALSRAIEQMLPPKRQRRQGVLESDGFVKIPDLADAVAAKIAAAIWYGSPQLVSHVREIVATALLIDLMGLIP